MRASPASFAAPRWFRPLWLLWMYLVLAPTIASAATPPVVADFDGDGQPDRAELIHREPSAVRVWLSATRRIKIVRSSTPILAIAARDLDGDRRAELIASRASTGLKVWTKGRRGIAAFRAKHVTRSTLSRPTRHRVNDGPAEAVETTDQGPPEPPVASLPQQASVAVLTAARVSTRIVVVPESSPLLAPLGPRPPPLSH